ncbi:MAG: penicillin acylase family protein [Chitinophagales bacterium]|nr:penicillin acylase family protein [Chitinophagales bacterium]
MPTLIFALIFFLFPFVSFGQTIDASRITIARDSFGVPHIFAPTDAEVAYGLAWAHCEDNFRDIQLSFLPAKNMLGGVEGTDGVLFDFAMQFLSVDSLVEARYEKDLSPAFRKVLEGYVQGINAYAAAHSNEVLRKKSFPVTGQDIIKGYTMNTALMAGLGMALKAVKDNKIQEYYAPNDVGSNAVAVAPKKMVDGKGYLVINSHQPIEGRMAWYEAHLCSEEGWNIVGGLFPGGISIFVGSNERLGWAHTTNYHNFGDIYQLETNPANKKQYKYDGSWRDFTIKKAKLKVKLAGIKIPVKKKYQVCEYGPVLKTKQGYFAFRFPGYMDIKAAEQWFKMNKATDFATFQKAISMQSVPLFNIIYADADGNIMLHSGGKIPARNPKLDWTMPIKANTSAYKWDTILAYKQMPHVENPDCGYVFNANNTPLQCTGDECEWSGDFPGLQRFMYNRGDQFEYLLSKQEGPFTEAYLKEVKYNTGYSANGTYMAHFKKMFELDTAKYPDIADAIQKLKHWNLQGGADNKDAALAMIVHDYLRLQADAPFALLMIRLKPVEEAELVEAIRWAKKFMLKTHGTIDIALGEVQRLIRGDKSFPADGLREVPRAQDAKLYDKKKGIYRIVGGDGYIQIARFGKNGAEISSVNAYGASDRKDSPHYTDQMEMFCNREYKQMPLDKATVLKNAERVYQPK